MGRKVRWFGLHGVQAYEWMIWRSFRQPCVMRKTGYGLIGVVMGRVVV